MVVGATYAALLMSETFLWATSFPRLRPEFQRNLYKPDQTLGIVLNPGYSARFDDGYAQWTVKVNALGQRDDPPRQSQRTRVLLVGDSFAYGELVDQRDRIDRQVEHRRRDLDVYNLGVSGYNFPDLLMALHRSPVTACHVVYLFYPNDLDPPLSQTVVDGFRVFRRTLPNGQPEPLSTVRRTIARQVEEARKADARHARWWVPPLRTLSLPRLRQLVAATARTIGLAEPRNAANGLYGENAPPAAVQRAVAFTDRMARHAKGKGMTFQQFIIPTLDEVRRRAHGPATNAYIAELKRAGIAPVDLLPALRRDHYWAHDGHFNAAGAAVAADAIAAAVTQMPAGPPCGLHRAPS